MATQIVQKTKESKNLEAVLEFELALEFVRVVEDAAMASAHTMGLGDRHKADQVATEAMRQTMESVPMRGTIVIGEGERDKAPMLYIGEHVGAGWHDGARVEREGLGGTCVERRDTARLGLQLPAGDPPLRALERLRLVRAHAGRLVRERRKRLAPRRRRAGRHRERVVPRHRCDRLAFAGDPDWRRVVIGEDRLNIRVRSRSNVDHGRQRARLDSDLLSVVSCRSHRNHAVLIRIFDGIGQFRRIRRVIKAHV